MADRFASLMSLSGNDVSVHWLITLMHFLWQGAVIGGIAVIAGSVLRGATARTRYALYSAALVSLPICVAVTFCIVAAPADLRSSARLPDRGEIPARPSPALASPAAVPTEAAETTDAAGPSERGASNTATIRSSVDTPSESPANASLPLHSRVAPWIAVAYIVGVACFLLRLFTALWGGWRLKSLTVPVNNASLLRLIADQADRVQLKSAPLVGWCERVAAPTVVGVLRPMILLPLPLMTALHPDDFAAIIRHELAHIRRCDLWVNLLQRVIESLLFFHPAVWFISRRLSAEREVCCDDLVVRSGYEPLRYAGALLRMAELCAAARRPAALSLAASGEGTPLLERRIERLMNWGQAPRLQLTRTGMAGLLLTLASLIVVLPGIAHSWAKAKPPGDDSKPAAKSQPADADDTQAGLRAMRQPAFRLPDHWRVMAVRFDNDGKELVTASTRSFVTVRRWDVEGMMRISEIKLAADKHGRPVRHGTLTLSADCRRVVAATDEYVGIWDTATGKLVKRLPIPTIGVNDTVRVLACTPDVSRIAAAVGANYDRTTQVYDAHAVVWDVASGRRLQTITHHHGNNFFAMALSSDGKRLATTNGGHAVIWDTSTGKRLDSFPNDRFGRKPADPHGRKQYNHVRSVRFSPDGNQLAIGGHLGVEIVSPQTGELLHRIDAPYRYSSGHPRLEFSQDGRLLARMGTQTGDDNVVPIWSTQTGNMHYELHTESNDCAFSPDGRQIAIAFSDRKMGLAVWQLAGDAPDIDEADKPGPESSKNKIAENTHYQGKKAAEFIDDWKPTWGGAQLGIEYGVAFTSPQRKFQTGERIPLAAFFRNASDKPLQLDVRPDLFWNVPKVVNAQGAAVEIEKTALLGTIPHYRDKLQPGEALGPFYLNFGLGENPRPGRQNWSPFWKTPMAGQYRLTHTLWIKVRDLPGGNEPKSDGWKEGELTSGMIDFEIAERSEP